MTRRSPRTLDELLGIAPVLMVTCLRCKRVRLFDCAAIIAHFRQRHWSLLLDQACQRFVCRGPGGCGSRAGHLQPSTLPLPPAPPPPPEPILDERAIRLEIRRRRG